MILRYCGRGRSKRLDNGLCAGEGELQWHSTAFLETLTAMAFEHFATGGGCSLWRYRAGWGRVMRQMAVGCRVERDRPGPFRR